MPVSTYNPGAISVIVGAKILSGWSDDAQVTIERDSDLWNDSVSADGDVVRGKNIDRRGKITLQLMQSSASNDDLTALALADELNGSGMFPVIVRDGSGTTVATSAQSWIMKNAATSFGRSIASREWTIRCADLIMYVGGNETA